MTILRIEGHCGVTLILLVEALLSLLIFLCHQL
jgi:hypothetical protein